MSTGSGSEGFVGGSDSRRNHLRLVAGFRLPVCEAEFIEGAWWSRRSGEPSDSHIAEVPWPPIMRV